MNAKEDILNNGDLTSFKDYTIFRRRTPKSNGSSEKKKRLLNNWYIKIIPNNNKRIKYRYWVCVCGYLIDNKLIQSSVILDVESPRELLTENSVYVLGKMCDVLNQIPHPFFSHEVACMFLGGFPKDWKLILGREVCRIVEVESKANFTPIDEKCDNLFNKRIEDILEDEEGIEKRIVGGGGRFLEECPSVSARAPCNGYVKEMPVMNKNISNEYGSDMRGDIVHNGPVGLAHSAKALPKRPVTSTKKKVDIVPQSMLYVLKCKKKIDRGSKTPPSVGKKKAGSVGTRKKVKTASNSLELLVGEKKVNEVEGSTDKKEEASPDSGSFLASRSLPIEIPLHDTDRVMNLHDKVCDTNDDCDGKTETADEEMSEPICITKDQDGQQKEEQSGFIRRFDEVVGSKSSGGSRRASEPRKVMTVKEYLLTTPFCKGQILEPKSIEGENEMASGNVLEECHLMKNSHSSDSSMKNKQDNKMLNILRWMDNEGNGVIPETISEKGEETSGNSSGYSKNTDKEMAQKCNDTKQGAEVEASTSEMKENEIEQCSGASKSISLLEAKDAFETIMNMNGYGGESSGGEGISKENLYTDGRYMKGDGHEAEKVRKDSWREIGDETNLKIDGTSEINVNELINNSPTITEPSSKGAKQPPKEDVDGLMNSKDIECVNSMEYDQECGELSFSGGNLQMGSRIELSFDKKDAANEFGLKLSMKEEQVAETIPNQCFFLKELYKKIESSMNSTSVQDDESRTAPPPIASPRARSVSSTPQSIKKKRPSLSVPKGFKLVTKKKLAEKFSTKSGRDVNLPNDPD